MKQKRRLGRGYLSLQAKRRGRKENRLQRDVDTHQRHGNEHGTRPATRIFCSAPATFQKLPEHHKHFKKAPERCKSFPSDPATLYTPPGRATRHTTGDTCASTWHTTGDRRHTRKFEICWPPRVRRRPLSEILLWSTGSPASWRVSQTPECSGLLTATRGICLIVPQRQPGKFKSEQANSPRSLAVPAGRRGRGRKPIPGKGGRTPCPSGSDSFSQISRITSVWRGI